MFKELSLFLFSTAAFYLYNLMKPVTFQYIDCNNEFSEVIEEDGRVFVIRVRQFAQITKTKRRWITSKRYYYKTDITVIKDNAVVYKLQDQFSDSMSFLWSKTKLPHAVASIAAVDKLHNYELRVNAA